jgi:acid phosphatase (class A)
MTRAMRLKRVIVVFAFVLFQFSAQAAWRIDPANLSLPPPPKSGSEAEQKDFKILLDYQEQRTDEQCHAADLQTSHTTATLFGPQTGVLSQSELERVDEFGDELIDTVDKASKPFKKRYSRERPYDANPEIKPCITIPGGHTSYPSSHAAMGIVLGEFLGRIFPEKADAIHAEAMQVGDNRVLGGVHHPTDIAAGRALAKQIITELMDNQDFTESLKAMTH